MRVDVNGPPNLETLRIEVTGRCGPGYSESRRIIVCGLGTVTAARRGHRMTAASLPDMRYNANWA
jgi:hypothetical protein